METIKSTIVFVVILIVVMFPIFFGHAYFEARAYNRLTGASVSTWDAVFIELRVQAQPRDD